MVIFKNYYLWGKSLLDNKNSFCVLPWIHSFVNNGGEYQVCCTGEEYGNEILDNDGKPFNISSAPSIDSVMNSDYMKGLRQDMMNGKIHPSCERCVRTEFSGGLSRRQIENEEYKSKITNLLKETRDDGEISVSPISIDYRLGNSCNLVCRMCNPKSSKKWVRQIKNLSKDLQDKAYENNLESYLKIDWSSTSLIIEEFRGKSAYVEKLHFAGGEPLISKKMEELLEYCIRLGISKNITLSYNTNLTILPEKILSLWKQFKEVKLLVSLDGIGRLDDYIRYPSDFSVIHNNLKYLDQNNKALHLSEILISSTVQMNNIFHLADFFDYLEQFKFVRKVPNFILLHFPEYLQVNCLPRSLAVMANLKIGELIKKIEAASDRKLGNDNEFLIQNLRQVQNALSIQFSNQRQEKLFNDFLRFSSEFDKEKSLNLIEVNPEFKLFYEKI